jgi:hypothetical protein
MPVQVELADIKGSEGKRARKLYAEPIPPKGRPAPAARPKRPSFQERSAPARGRMAERKRATRTGERNAARGRTTRNRAIRGVGRRSLRVARTAHRAAGSPGGLLAGGIALFVGAGIVVAVVKNPSLITVPLRFISAVVKAFTGLLNAGGGAKPATPQQNVPKGN